MTDSPRCPSCGCLLTACSGLTKPYVPLVPGPMTATAGWPVGWQRLCRLQLELADSVRLGERLTHERDGLAAALEMAGDDVLLAKLSKATRARDGLAAALREAYEDVRFLNSDGEMVHGFLDSAELSLRDALDKYGGAP